MLNKDQMFLVHEFIKKNSQSSVWYVSDDLFKLATELIKEKKQEENKVEENSLPLAA
jgi:hypothetical protein